MIGEVARDQDQETRSTRSGQRIRPGHGGATGGLFVAFVALLLLAVPPAAPAVEYRPGGSAEVLYSFPRSADDISVGRNGENTFSLKIPSFPAYLTSNTSAVYNSRGSDSVMGVGWELPVPSISLDFSDHTDALDQPAAESPIVTPDGVFIKGRWVTDPGGKLVCRRRNPNGGLERFNCHLDPRGPMRYTPSGAQFAQQWKAVDPLEGVTQYFGEGDASRIYNDDKAVAWLLSREVSRHGKEVRYFYEELDGDDQRLLRAIHFAGDKTIRFNYQRRTAHITSSYQMSVRRTSEWLLTEIQLLDRCTPIQLTDGRDHVRTAFDECPHAVVVEKVRLEYDDPDTRYTGRYVLRSWRHMSGDESISYQAVRFDYNGDGVASRGNGAVTGTLVNEVTPDFKVPDGYSLITNTGYGPYQNYADWNRDGLADWISTKGDNNKPWPTWNRTNHRIHVRLRNADGAFDAKHSYDEPLAKHAAWIGVSPLVPFKSLYTESKDSTASGQIAIPDESEFSDRIREYWPHANIGINATPWIYSPGAEGSQPLFESLSMTVPCAKLGTVICAMLLDTYRTVWSAGFDTEFDEIGIKLTDLHDYNGDGYLDRGVSGLLVVWDPEAPDADANGMREPATGDPCIYVSLFNPDTQRFDGFIRYSITPPDGRFAPLSAAFLSALAVNYKHNSDVSSGDMSAQGAARSLMTALGLGAQVYGVARQFPPANAAAESPAGAEANNNAFGFSGAASVAGLALTATNVAANLADAPPEVTTGLAYASLAHTGVTGAYTAVESVKAATDATGLASAAGWAGFANAIVAVAAQTTNTIWRTRSKKRMEAAGYNAGAVASNTKTGTAIVSIVAATVGIAATILLVAAGVATVPVVGWIIGIVLAVFSLAISLWSLLSAEGNFETADGKVWYDLKTKRGVVYKNKSDPDHASHTKVLLDWMDITGNGRLDLVVAKYSPDEKGFAVSPGATQRGWASLQTGAWRAWTFPVSNPPKTLNKLSTDTRYEGGDSQRADQSDGDVGMVDINGDGLVDLVDARSPPSYGYRAYLNNGREFGEEVFFSVPQNPPSGCTGTLKLSRSRSVSWTEYVNTKEGYSVALSNVVQTLGPDLDNNGLPDIVIKDEKSYGQIAAGGNCVLHSGSNMCDAVLPADPEPEGSGQNKCTSGANIWYAKFDGWNKKNGDGEGESHLSKAANEIHSPKVKGHHYVAFNTGEGFTPFIKIEQKLPSFGGGLTVISITNEDNDLPDPALSGTSNALVDPDADGQLQLVAMDIGAKKIWKLKGSHPVAHQYEIGLKNADALTRITYPEGGFADFVYALNKDVQGEQGPPIWVLNKVTFKDRVRADFNTAEGWQWSAPFVEYAYAGAKLREREFLGFEAIAERRYSGSDITQFIQVYEQDGAARGSVRCTEVRGRVVDNVSRLINGKAEDTMCITDPVRKDSLKISPVIAGNDAKEVVSSCLAGAEDKLGIDLLPLQLLTRYSYDSEYTLERTLPNDETDELWRAFVNNQIVTYQYDGAAASAWLKLDIEYDPPPYQTPTLSVATTNHGLRRSLRTQWIHRDDEWIFQKRSERKLNGDDSVHLATRYQYDTDYPFDLIEIREISKQFEQERYQRFLAYSSGGLPERIEDNGILSQYRYYDDGENGTALLRSFQREGDRFQPVVGTEKYAYDVMGRVTRHHDLAGNRSTYKYDALGVLKWDELSGQTRRDYKYYDIGQVDFTRHRDYLGGSQRTLRVDTINNQQIIHHTWWDGFLRKYRQGVMIEGHQTIDLDFDGDGNAEQSLAFKNDRQWFARRKASYLLRDYRLNGPGERQCTSLPYLDGKKPAAYRAALYDPLRRIAYSRNAQGFATTHHYDVSDDRLAVNERRNDMGHTFTIVYDGFERAIDKDNAGLIKEHYQYQDWDARVRRTDGRGFVEIWEPNPWGEPVKHCGQVDGVAPAANQCPQDWPTTLTRYDAHGQPVLVRDANGHETEMEYANCGVAGRVTYPSVSSGDPSARPRREVRLDAACREQQVTEANGSITELSYDSGGRLSDVTVAKGSADEASAAIGYDDLGRRLYTQDFSGRRVYKLLDFRDLPVEHRFAPRRVATRVYGVHGNIKSKTSPSGRTVEFETDLAGRTTRARWKARTCDLPSINNGTFATQPVQAEHRFVYDAKGRLTDEYAADGARAHYEYDAADRLTRRYATDLANRSQFDANVYNEITYDAAGNAASRRLYGGLLSEFGYDGLGRRTSNRLVAANGRIIESRYAYDNKHNVVTVTPPNGITPSACVIGAADPADFQVRNEYTPQDKLEKQWSPVDRNGRRVSFTRAYDTAGRLRGTANPRGKSVQLSYDARNRLQSYRDPLGNGGMWTYSENSDIKTVTDARSLATSFRYDDLGMQREIIDSRGIPRIADYDPDGRPLAYGGLIDPVSNLWQGHSVEYDVAGRVKQMDRVSFTGAAPPNPDDWVSEQSERMCYDAVGRLLAHTDGNGSIFQRRYDNRGRHIEDWLPPVGPAGWVRHQYKYNDDNLLVGVSEPMGGNGPARLQAEYRYDGFNRQVEFEFEQSDHITRFSYDDNSNVCASEDIVAGSTVRRIDFTYDPRNRLLREDDNAGSVYEYGYDDNGNIVHIDEPAGRWEYAHDELDRPIRQTQRVDAINTDFVTGYHYDAVGDLTRIDLPLIPGMPQAPSQVRIQRQPDSYLASEVSIDGRPLLGNPQYDGSGRLTRWVQGGVLDHYDRYDNLGRLEERQVDAGANAIHQANVTYDDANNIVYVDDTVDDAFDIEVGLDARSRITSQAGAALAGMWQYRWNHQDLLRAARSPTGVVRQFDYGADGALASFGQGGRTVAYTRDDFGNRREDGRSRSRFRFDARDRVVAVEQATGTIEYSYAHDGRRLSAGDKLFVYTQGRLPAFELDVAGGVIQGARYNGFVGDDLVLTQDARTGERRLFVTDRLASPVAETDGSGNLVAERAFDAFGRGLARSGRAAQSMSTDIGFQGNYWMPETETYLMHHRLYDPQTFSFISPDPLGDRATGTRYGFAQGNPLRYTDRLGLQSQDCGSNPNCTTIFDDEVSANWGATVVADPIDHGLPDIVYQTAVYSGIDYQLLDPANQNLVDNIVEAERLYEQGDLPKYMRDAMIKNSTAGIIGSDDAARAFVENLDAAKEGDGYIYEGEGFFYNKVVYRKVVADTARSGVIELEAYDRSQGERWFEVTEQHNLEALQNAVAIHELAEDYVTVAEAVVTLPVAGLELAGMAVHGSRLAKLGVVTDDVFELALAADDLSLADDWARAPGVPIRTDPSVTTSANLLLETGDPLYRRAQRVSGWQWNGDDVFEVVVHGGEHTGASVAISGPTPVTITGPVNGVQTSVTSVMTNRTWMRLPEAYLGQLIRNMPGLRAGQPIRINSCWLGACPGYNLNRLAAELPGHDILTGTTKVFMDNVPTPAPYLESGGRWISTRAPFSIPDNFGL